MADQTGKTPADLTALLQRLQEKPYEFSFFHALRLIECRADKKPRLGESKKPADDAVRLAQEPEMTFAPATITACEISPKLGLPRLLVRFLGLLGPAGPLPLHFTEYARTRQRVHGDRTFSWFLDMFHHRMLSLFYRAWAANEPTVSFDRPESDRFAFYVGSLGGLGMPGLQGRDEMSDAAKLHYAGLLSNQRRSADGLQAMVENFFRLPATVKEFIGEWLAVPNQYLCYLGMTDSNNRLGQSALAGTKVWSRQHKFRIVLGPLDYNDYLSFLPTGERLKRLKALVQNYAGDEMSWDVNLLLHHEETPATRLNGHSRLGWTSWMGKKQDETDTDDLLLDVPCWVK